MTDPGIDRPGSRGHPASPVPPSPRPSVASRASRSSLRRDHERLEGQAHPRPASPHVATAASVEEHPPPPSPSPLQPAHPPFSPIFTLINSTALSSNRQTVHHPTVHYVFADDDPEILTAALAHHHRGAYEDGGGAGSPNSPVDRAILLDMEPTADGAGYQVTWASSLTPDWAVTSTQLSRVEGGGGGSASGPNGNLVLKIEGVSIEPAAGPLGKAATPEAELHSPGGSGGRQPPPPAAEEYADLIQDFERRMSTLRKAVEAGAARQRALGDTHGQFSEGTPLDNRVTDPFRPGTGVDET